MRLKIYLSMILLFLGIGITNAQNNDYYYYKGEKIPLRLDRQSLTVSMFKGFTKSSLRGLNIKKINTQNSEGIEYSTIEYQTKPTDKEYNQNLKKLKNNGSVRTVSPNFLGQNGEKIGMSDYFYVKLKKTGDFRKLKQLARKKKVRIIEQNQFMPLWYTLRCTENTIENTLEVANSFFETRWFASSSPDFLIQDDSSPKSNKISNQLREMDPPSEEEPTTCANDPKFDEQWGLHNSSNSDIDINACDAWEVTEGEGVTVAVLDKGIELTHIDLADNISSLSYDTETKSSPSKIYGSGTIFVDNGTHAAGIIGAVRNNGIQVAGVAPKATLISISNSLLDLNSRIKLADGINWAWQHGADVINNSWTSPVQYDAIDDAIENALTKGRNGRGTIMVFSAGNMKTGFENVVRYPANSRDDIIAVGSIDSKGNRPDFATHGDELDVVAPGAVIISTTVNNSTGLKSGSSFSTAHVSGVAALVLSVNPCLSAQQVKNIIEKTSQKVGEYDYAENSNRPNGTWNNETGYGLVDAHAAVQMAQQTDTPLDLYIKDSPDDIGEEPNTITGRRIWRSPDIWIRNRADGIEEHQNPVYKRNNNRNYVYVRITNKSCAASTGGDQVKLYWRKAGTVSRWPESWDGTTSQNGVLMGAPIGTIYIPALEPGEEVILSFPWNMPNPRDYSNISPNTWHFCLLARIVSEDDPMTNEQEDRYTSTNARKNNNIAWKNVTVVKASSRKRKCNKWDNCSVKKGGTQSNFISFGGLIFVGNPFNEAKTFSLELVKEESETGKAIFDEAEVVLTMDKTLYNAWKRGGKQSELLKNTNDEKKKIVTGNHARLNNLRFGPNEFGLLNVSFNFLTKELTDKLKFVYHVIQKETETGEVIGGETYVINKDLQVETEGSVKEDRKLEINNKTISIGKASLNKIIPNPASNTARFTYNLGGAKSAYLIVTGFYHGATKTSTNYDLDINSTETTLDLTNYSDGHYQVALVCDGKIVEAKTLIKE